MKKILCAALAACTALTFFSGCQKSGGNTGESNAKKTELLLGLPGGDGGTPWEIVENFKAANADKYIVTEDTAAWGDFTQKLKLQFVSKNDVTPVFFTDSMQAMTFGAQGAVLDLADWVNNTLDTESYNAALFAISDKEGHLWGVPHGLNSIAMLYNKDIFDEKGIPYPTEDWTWQEMLDTAKKLTYDRDGDGKTDVYGINYTSNITQGWLPFMSAVGVSPYKNDFRDSNLNDPLVKEAMEKYAQPIRDGLLLPAAEIAADGGVEVSFTNGKLAMALVQSGSIAKVLKFKPDMNFDAQIMPIGWNGERTCIYVPNTWQVYAGVDDDVKEAALAWLEYYLSEEAQMIKANNDGTFPILQKALDSVTASGREPEHINVFYKGIDDHGLTLLENPASYVTRTIVDDMTTKIQGGEDIDKSIAEAHEAMQNELDYFYENR